ncbi:hypothetical protein AMAG_06657 [Allomyces macrogynus ATCC 38327]|uniref:SMP-LTD domain-containing protein n=1 Tax=Allomyces macrogynus (strain ATCC 38327) TaxID=578462 RepID=A0A0L0SEI5_ALLM3|nr:hypothetical protein AMAG_06657 [Allomyces macrogynus ATCC 38327]|eukprot:KNE60896.1 hypothetical protein AMAG_06657 [Allomyces macrogynus ATCC 38327]
MASDASSASSTFVALGSAFLFGLVAGVVVAVVLAVGIALHLAKLFGLRDNDAKEPRAPSGTHTASTRAAPRSSAGALAQLLRERDAQPGATDASHDDDDDDGPEPPGPSHCMGWLRVYRRPLDEPAPEAPAVDPTAAAADPIINDGSWSSYAAAHRTTAVDSSSADSAAPAKRTRTNSITSALKGVLMAKSVSASASDTASAVPGPSVKHRGSNAAATPPPLPSTPGCTAGYERARSPLCFGVLRHHSLFLYEDASLLECVGVILLPLHNVRLHPRGLLDDVECFIKDTPIWLSKVEPDDANADEGDSRSMAAGSERSLAMDGNDRPPDHQRDYFLYATTALEKEAWYLALRRASATGRRERVCTRDYMTHYRSLIARLHGHHHPTADPSTPLEEWDAPPPTSLPPRTGLEANSMAWLNALIGRFFLSVRAHDSIRTMILAKVHKKLDKLPTPSFLTNTRVSSVDTGTAAPMFTDPVLVALDPAGQVEVEVDVSYDGGARIELSTDVVLSLGNAVASITQKLGGSGSGSSGNPDLSSSPTSASTPSSSSGYDFRVPVVLGVTMRALRGRIRILMRAPPSNRVWVGFVAPPDVNLCAEPVVNAKQLRLGLVLDFIEGKLRDVINTSMVLPNMDDFCFCPSADMDGGLFYPKPPPAPAPASRTATSMGDLSGAVAATAAGGEQQPTQHVLRSAMSAPTASPSSLPPRHILTTAPALLSTGPSALLATATSAQSLGTAPVMALSSSTATGIFSSFSADADGSSSSPTWLGHAADVTRRRGAPVSGTARYAQSVKRGMAVLAEGGHLGTEGRRASLSASSVSGSLSIMTSDCDEDEPAFAKAESPTTSPASETFSLRGLWLFRKHGAGGEKGRGA